MLQGLKRKEQNTLHYPSPWFLWRSWCPVAQRSFQHLPSCPNEPGTNPRSDGKPSNQRTVLVNRKEASLYNCNYNCTNKVSCLYLHHCLNQTCREKCSIKCAASLLSELYLYPLLISSVWSFDSMCSFHETNAFVSATQRCLYGQLRLGWRIRWWVGHGAKS